MTLNKPKYCLMCQARLNHELSLLQFFHWQPIQFPPLCLNCQSMFQRIDVSGCDCQGCGRLLDNKASISYKRAYYYDEQAYCLDCYRWVLSEPTAILNHRAIFDYNMSLQEWIVRYKYQLDVRMAHVMREPLQEIYQQYKDYIWIVLPSAPESLIHRGFHPVAYLLDCANIPYVEGFDYIGDGIKQATKSRKERLALKATFQLNQRYPQWQDHPLLIFDDIYTTGATLMEAKRQVLQADRQHHIHRKIRSLSLARDQLEEDEEGES